MKEKIFNIVVYGMLAYTVAVAGYGALPTEYQNMIPFNWVTALVSGGTTGLLGTAGLVFKTQLNNAKIKAQEQFTQLASSYESVVGAYENVKQQLSSIKKEYEWTRQELTKVTKFLHADLQSKLTNPYLDVKVRELIEGVVNENK